MGTKRIISGLILFSLLVPGSGALAQTIIDNPTQPAQGLVQAKLVEQWRLGGEDEDFFFGTVARVNQDPQGNIYILDGQLCQVHVISADGEFLRSVSGEGDGPGEVRRPNDFFMGADGSFNILSGFPGKVIRLAADGTPLGSIGFSADGQPSKFGVLIRGLDSPDGMILGGIAMSFGGSSLSKQTYYVSRCDRNGNQINRLFEKEHTIDYSDFHYDELPTDFVWRRLTADQQGRIYMAQPRNEYAITVLNPDGTPLQVIKRAYQAPARTERQKKIARQLLKAIAANYPSPLKGVAIEKTEPVIGSLATTNDHQLWVRPAIADNALPAGTWALFDVFDSAGHFTKQVALTGAFNRNRDAAYILDDGRVLVVTGALDAFLNQMGAGGDEAAPEVTPLEVICFKLEM